MFRKINVAAALLTALVSCPAALAQVQFSFPIPFAKGTEPSVTSIRTGHVIEVHQFGDDTMFQIGELSGQKITWGSARAFPWKMYNARVYRSDSTGAIILSYTGAPHGGGCFYRVGSLDGGLEANFYWHTGEEKWGTCEHTRDSRIVLDIFGSAYGIYSDFSQVFFRTGRMQFYQAISWQNGDEPQHIGHARDVDIASKDNQLVELYEEAGPGIIGSRPATVSTNAKETVWGAAVSLPTTGAVRGHATIRFSHPNGSVVALYIKPSFGLYTMTGRLEGTPNGGTRPRLAWTSGEKEVFAGPVQNSDITNTVTSVIEVHESGGQLFYAVGPMPAPNIAGGIAGSATHANFPVDDGQ
jgi:hypothetical protein